MVVKASRGRRRYIAFSLGNEIPKSDLERRISSTGYGQVRIIQCAGGWCILRCEPRLLKRIMEIMTEICPGSESKATSGNLLTLRRRCPILWETRPRYIAFTVAIDERAMADAISSRAGPDGPELKFCGSGHAIVKCALRDSDRTKEMISQIDPGSSAFTSSYSSKDIRRSVADRVPELRSVLLARK